MTDKPKTKHTPIGEIPVGWETGTIGDVGQVSYGLTVNMRRREHPRKLPCVTVSDFTAGRLTVGSPKHIGCLPGDERKYALEAEDVLVVEGNGNPNLVGRATLWGGSNQTVLHQNHLLRVRLDPRRLLPDLLVESLNSDLCRRYLGPRIVTSSGLSTLNSKTLGACPVHLPPLPEQRKIAQILATWDRAIKQTEKRIAAKERLKKGLMQQLLTGKLRFPEFGGEEWRPCRLRDVAEECRERNTDEALGNDDLMAVGTVK